MADSTLTSSPPTAAHENLPLHDPTALVVEHYLVERELAHGGLGRVLVAQDRRLGRRVALKVPLSAEADVAHFRHEVEITSKLQHPSIVPLYEAGRLPSGEPFFAMKLLEGRSLSAAIAEAKDPRARLALLPSVIAVAEAIAYAHDQGIIHRDIKPSNVLLGPFGEAVVLDWGEACALVRAAAAPAQEVVGTPSYMAPEQARGEGAQATADVYALGALLYHVVTGHPPYRGNSPAVLVALAAGPPPSVEERWPEAPPELAAIIGKAMARDPAARYPSARELAEDLRRFETGQLVSSYAYSPWALVRRWLWRHRVAVTVAVIMTAALAATAIASYQRVVQAQKSAERRRDALILSQARTAMQRDPTTAVAWLKQYPPSGADWPTARLLFAEAIDRGVARELYPASHLDEWTSDGKTIVIHPPSGEIQVWREGRKLRSFMLPTDELLASFAIQEDGSQLFLAMRNGTVRGFDVATGQLRIIAKGEEGNSILGATRVSPDGRTLAVLGAHDEIWLYPTAGGAPRRRAGHKMVIHDHWFSPDGKWVASGGGDKTVRVWSVEGDQARVLGEHAAEVRKVRFSPDSAQVMSSSYDGTVRVWPLAGGAPRVLGPEKGRVLGIEVSPDGKSIAVVGDHGLVKLYDEKGGARVFSGHTNTVNEVSFSSDGKTLVTGGEEDGVRVWDVATGDSRALYGHRAQIIGVTAFGDGRRVASKGFNEALRVFEVPPPAQRRLVESPAPMANAVFSPDGKSIATCGWDRQVRLCDAATLACRVLGEHGGPVYGLRFTPDGRTLASSGDDGTLRLWNLADGSARVWKAEQGPLKRMTFSPDGRRLLTAGDSPLVKLWEVASGESRVLWKHEDSVMSVAFSPDGEQVASAALDTMVHIGDLSGKHEVLRGHGGWVLSASFSPDGKQVASASFDFTVRLWDVATRKGTVLGRHENAVVGLAWSPDGSKLASSSLDRTARLWDLPSGTHRVLGGHEAALRAVVFSKDGTQLATGDEDRIVRVWDVATGMGRTLQGHGGPTRGINFSPDGKRLLSASMDKTVRIWMLDALPPIPLEPAELRAAISSATHAELDARDQLDVR